MIPIKYLNHQINLEQLWLFTGRCQLPQSIFVSGDIYSFSKSPMYPKNVLNEDWIEMKLNWSQQY